MHEICLAAKAGVTVMDPQHDKGNQAVAAHIAPEGDLATELVRLRAELALALGQQARTGLAVLNDFINKGTKPDKHEIFIAPKLITQANLAEKLQPLAHFWQDVACDGGGAGVKLQLCEQLRSRSDVEGGEGFDCSTV